MCQIFYLPPGVMPDEEDFKSSFITNQDGWGGVVSSDSSVTPKLEYKWSSFKTTPDWEVSHAQAVEWIKEHSDNSRIVHMRYATKGGVTLENAHPIIILDSASEQEDFTDIAMVHNGTLPGINPTGDKSDTLTLAEEIVTPLFRGLTEADPTVFPPDYDYVGKILQKFTGSSSRLVFLDGEGRVGFVNEDQGEWQDKGYWVANTYSFNRSHRNKTTSSFGFNGSNYGRTETKITPSTPVSTPKALEDKTKNKDGSKKNPELVNPNLMISKFSRAYNLAQSDLLYLSEDALFNTVENMPDDAVLLIQELQSICAALTDEIGDYKAQLSLASGEETTIKQTVKG